MKLWVNEKSWLEAAAEIRGGVLNRDGHWKTNASISINRVCAYIVIIKVLCRYSTDRATFFFLQTAITKYWRLRGCNRSADWATRFTCSTTWCRPTTSAPPGPPKLSAFTTSWVFFQVSAMYLYCIPNPIHICSAAVLQCCSVPPAHICILDFTNNNYNWP